ncbi:sodium/potassium-transporting ATPase subunit beta-2-like [Plodia interpunctella]|uniref:sodium/potassium-transporting ATPase subunit beta-2-like n=1 Tax=Plodia interpunctella TaxID=58824 RepID=UPI0023685145|nr:sodium/potassium-transporting ATPase subunit beta-2-like [Plodia interpunctella]
MGAHKQNGEINYCRRPPDRPFLQKIKYALWNPEEGKVLGRTPHRWGVIGLIYLVMYICIIIFFSICMTGLLYTMDEKIPYFQLADSIIGDNPGMGHRPLIFEEGALIWYIKGNKTQYQKYIDNLNEFLLPYENKSMLINKGVNQIDCPNELRPPRDEVCAFDVTKIGACTKDTDYGYSGDKPCFVIKLNKLYGFKPDYYDTLEDLPEDIPQHIRDYMTEHTAPEERRKVWVSCAGERGADRDALGDLKYYPHPGFSQSYFPYDNTAGYLSPLVFVEMQNPGRRQILNIRCRAWAKNIRYSESLKNRLGSTHLEIMID